MCRCWGKYEVFSHTPLLDTCSFLLLSQCYSPRHHPHIAPILIQIYLPQMSVCQFTLVTNQNITQFCFFPVPIFLTQQNTSAVQQKHIQNKYQHNHINQLPILVRSKNVKQEENNFILIYCHKNIFLLPVISKCKERAE